MRDKFILHTDNEPLYFKTVGELGLHLELPNYMVQKIIDINRGFVPKKVHKRYKELFETIKIDVIPVVCKNV
jgi:hypothetical protein